MSIISKLTIRHLKENRKRTIVTILGIAMSTALITAMMVGVFSIFKFLGYVAVITWSSPHYDYMIVDDEKYLPINEDGNSVFEIPFKDLSAPVTVIADTVAMSEPHEIEYTLTFDMSEVD